MDFFQAQAAAHRRTKRLIGLFVLSVGATIVVTYIAIVFVSGMVTEKPARHPYRDSNYDIQSAVQGEPAWWDPQLFAMVAGGTIAMVAGATLFKSAQLRQGGPAIAEMVGGRRIESNTIDLKEKRLLNVVEEMSIASGISVPAVYVLDGEDGLNAFAAGLTTSDAVVAVTRGTLEKLNRDELQGVIAHEFSHILNGDMRMNIRLVAVLFGIFFLTIVGRGLLRVLSHARGRNRKGDARILIIAAASGVVLIVIGYIGYFFGRLIQAAVSRQREFLADASAVQFTRNPAGITNALKKIGGYALGGRLNNTHASAIGHFFFAEGIASNFLGLLATHPPLDVRIRAIDPQFDGKSYTVPQAADVEDESLATAGFAPPPLHRPSTQPTARVSQTATIASIGTLTPEQVTNAQALIDEIPQPLREAARTMTDANVLIFGLLIDTRAAVRQRQLAHLPASATTALFDLAEPLAALKPEHKLPLCQLALPALRDLPAEAQTDFLATIHILIEADGSVSTFEFALEKMIERQLLFSRSPRLSIGAQIYSFEALRDEILVVLSALTHASTSDSVSAQHAFREGTKMLKMLDGALELLAPASCGAERLSPALDRLAMAAGPIKQRVLLACAQCVSADGEIRVAEAELLRVFAMVLDCPMPPLAQLSHAA